MLAQAEPVIRAVLPDANVPASIRSAGVPVLHGSVSELDPFFANWLAEQPEGTAAVIATRDSAAAAFRAAPRVGSLTPELSKGLESDPVVLIGAHPFAGADVRPPGTTNGPTPRVPPHPRAHRQAQVGDRLVRPPAVVRLAAHLGRTVPPQP